MNEIVTARRLFFSVESSGCGKLSRNCSYVVSPGYPGGTSNSQACSYTISKVSSGDHSKFVPVGFELFTHGPTLVMFRNDRK